MSLVSSILPATNVVIDLEASDKKSLFELMGQLFEEKQQIARKAVFDSLQDRENLGSTGLGHGIAIPHGRIKGIRQAIGALVRLKNAIPFDAPDDKPVSLLFVLLVPAHASDLHLQILGELAQLFSNKTLRQNLFAVTDATQLHQLITGSTPP
jgi:PTS system nitrogen regulatory IIA component